MTQTLARIEISFECRDLRRDQPANPAETRKRLDANARMRPE
jgi:hypothetical protein